VPREAPFPFAVLLRAGADGTFATDDAPSSELSVVAIPARDNDLVAGATTVAAGSDDAAVDVALCRGATLHGVVRGAPGRGPVLVQAWNERAATALGYLGNLLGQRAVTAGEDGAYRLEGLIAGTHQVTVVQQQMLVRCAVAVAEGAEVECNLYCGDDGELRVAIEPRVPPAGAGSIWLVRLYRREPGGGLQFVNFTAADEQGSVMLRGAAPGASYDVVVALARGGFDQVIVAHLADVQPRREPHRLEIAATALPSSRLRGRLTDAHGGPRANQTLVARAAVGEVLVSIGSTITEIDGSFDLGPLPAGTWTLQLGTEPGAPMLGRHELRAGQALDLGELMAR
jgi:hypothetical protein